MRCATPSRNAARNSELRRRIAVEAARLISEHGIRDFHLAKRKAAALLHVIDDANLPRNSEIDLALREHHRLFIGTQQPRHLRFLREAAIAAMDFFQRFEPRLVGRVLDGTADQHSAVCLHLFSDTAEEVIELLDDHVIAYREHDRRQRMRQHEYVQFPGLSIQRHDVTFDLTLLPRDAIRQPPLDPVDERRQQRASLAEVRQLLAEDETRQLDSLQDAIDRR
ncbi:MAG TPA: hypothetical protein VFN13_05435 [Rudaea sp.]|nr:hypothetical protein [Rudaea sp.]